MYIFNAELIAVTENALHIGDHIPWHRPFDDTEDADSKIQHILVAKDPQLPDLCGPYGTLDFRQVSVWGFYFT